MTMIGLNPVTSYCMRTGYYIKKTFLLLIGIPVYVLLGGTAVHAQPTWEKLSLKGIVDILVQALKDVLIPFAVVVLFFVFIYGVFLYMHAANKGDGKMADLTKTRLLYGILILFAVFSLWGFVHILRSLFTG